MELRCRRCAWGVKLGWADCLRISLSHLFAPLLALLLFFTTYSYRIYPGQTLYDGWQ